jgi:hypothetical protein
MVVPVAGHQAVAVPSLVAQAPAAVAAAVAAAAAVRRAADSLAPPMQLHRPLPHSSMGAAVQLLQPLVAVADTASATCWVCKLADRMV